MKTSNLLLLAAAGVAAYYLFSNRSGSTPPVGDTTPMTAPATNNYFQYFGTSEQGSKSNPIDVMTTSISLSPVSFSSPKRFVGVTYDAGKSAGVLDLAAQQSITTGEASKRAANPFLPNMSYGNISLATSSTSGFIQKAIKGATTPMFSSPLTNLKTLKYV